MKMTRRGFSLIELLIVVAIIAALVGVAVPFFQDNLSDAQKTKARQDLDVIRSAINLHDAQNRPLIGSSLAPLKGRYLQEVPKDPWGNEYLLDADIGLLMCFGGDAQGGGEGIDQDLYFRYKPDLAIKRVQYDGTWGTAKPDAQVIVTMTKPFVMGSANADLCGQQLQLLRDLRVQGGAIDTLGFPLPFRGGTSINTSGVGTKPNWNPGGVAAFGDAKAHNEPNGVLSLENTNTADGSTQPITPTMALNFTASISHVSNQYGIVETSVDGGPMTSSIYGPYVDKYLSPAINTPLYNGENRGVKIERF
jgi:general secretion pathway protein G